MGDGIKWVTEFFVYMGGGVVNIKRKSGKKLFHDYKFFQA